jgi:type II secretory ATPase GspE/PulE/Tfp pilus assembly ATPase PilB-like protein
VYPSIEKIKSILLKESYISEEDSKAAEAKSQNGDEYVDFLIRTEVLDKRLLGQALAEAYGTIFVDFEANPPSKEDVNRIPEQIGREMRVVFVKASDQVVALATDDPTKIQLPKLADIFKGKKIRVVYALPEGITASLNLYQQPLETRFSRIIKEGTRVAPEIVDEIIKDALAYGASDIHFEPQVATVTVRFRVDGTLREAGVLPKENYENVLNRIKVESGMRIDEHLTAQDGALQRHLESLSADIRVSLVPTVQGEKVVMRLLSSYVQGYSLADIGLNARNRQVLEEAAAKPFGMILTVGPTGSGKTTTLYALLKMLNHPDVNITTIEDPVEYKMPAVNQIQVREASNMTFARGLRAIVRQDPDIILVGEIRDEETAEISVNAALTGHLLLSTFHANDAATAVPRLIDMGIEPFLLASTLEVIVAQRLVRKICSHCRYSLSAEEAIAKLKTHKEEIARYFAKADNLYAGKGCTVCSGTGYAGRSALYELISLTPDLQELIIKRPSSRDIERLARQEGSVPMFEDGIEKVKNGITSIAEVLRVVEPPVTPVVGK